MIALLPKGHAAEQTRQHGRHSQLGHGERLAGSRSEQFLQSASVCEICGQLMIRRLPDVEAEA
jgi:hypothetical protein